MNPIEPSSVISPAAVADYSDLGPFSPPPMGLDTDPFYMFRDELAQTMRKTLLRIERLGQMKDPDSIRGEISSIRKGIPSLKENVQHLERMVVHVERKRSDFAHLSDSDIAWRRKFLTTIHSRVRQMESKLVAGQNLAAKIAEDERVQFKQELEAKSRTATASARRKDDFDDGSDVRRYTAEQMFKEQDENLDEISASLGRLHAQGSNMYHELESQNALLGDVNDDALGLSGKMEGALGRLDKFLQTSSRGKTVSIMFLLGVLLIEIIILSVI